MLRPSRDAIVREKLCALRNALTGLLLEAYDGLEAHVAPIKRFLIELERSFAAEVHMRNHDFAADGFLALTAASFALLCSSLLSLAFT
jgi:hypothetical protein